MIKSVCWSARVFNIFRFIAIVLSMSAVSFAAAAMPTNGGFETGNLSGWSTIGDANVENPTLGIDPPFGHFQASITTRSNIQMNPELPFSGANAVDISALETFTMGFVSSQIRFLLELNGYGNISATEGSAIQTTFSAAAGETLSFLYNFLTAEGGSNDFAFVSVQPVGGVDAPDLLADVFTSTPVLSPTIPIPGGSVPAFFWDAETGYHQFSHVFAADGLYSLTIGVADTGDTETGSALLIDEVTLQAASAIPAPGSLALLVLGLAGLGCARRKRAA